ncbi:hypothetical protein DDT91_06630 [Algoriphagus sp. AK58]|nr:hypothetical protein [Algoriphagus sp. AK58]
MLLLVKLGKRKIKFFDSFEPLKKQLSGSFTHPNDLLEIGDFYHRLIKKGFIKILLPGKEMCSACRISIRVRTFNQSKIDVNPFLWRPCY